MPDQLLEIKKQNLTLLGSGARLQGEFYFSGLVRVCAQMEGILHLDSEGKLIIEREGSFQGTILAHEVDIFGEFQGQLSASGRVILRPSSKVSGKIDSKSMVIYPGATLNIEGHTDTSPSTSPL